MIVVGPFHFLLSRSNLLISMLIVAGLEYLVEI